MTMQEANNSVFFEKVAQILGLVHHFPHEKIFYAPPFKKVSNFMNEFIKRDLPMLDLFQNHYEIVKEIEGALDLYIPIAVVHSDFHNDNIIVDPASKAVPISVIDWESAGLGNPYYDLAYFTVRNDMDESNRMRFLKAYLGRDPTEQEEAYLYLTEQFYLYYRAMKYFAEIYQQKGVVLTEADHRALRDFIKSDWTLQDILHHEKDKQLEAAPPKSVPIHVKSALVYLKTFEQNVQGPEFQKRMALFKK
jgi:thiamine kinase-like enzyme